MQMQVSKAVETLVLATLPRFSPEDVLLHLCVVADATVFDNDEQITERRQIHLLFHRPGNYTKVFWHIVKQDHQRIESIPEDAWTLESDHDSCWTSDGLDSPMHKVHQEMIACFPEKYQKRISWHVRFDIFGGFHIFDECQLKRIQSSDPFNRGYTIKLGKIKQRLSI